MGLLAGKYAPLLGAGAAGLLGAGGSVLGNLQDTEQGEGPARIATEALMAGVNALPAGIMLGALPQGIRYAQKNAVKSIPRASKDLRQQARQQINQQAGVLAGSQIASVPIAAGIGGLIGGGLSNVANAIGVPGFQQGMQPGMVINPESYGSSNINYTV
jgi:uncharacterized protein YcfJ